MLDWIPVLQGWDADDYRIHELMYQDAGVDLAAAVRVGIGSICRRGHLPDIVEVVEQFADSGYRLHGFGVKTTALPLIGCHLRSADSMAWSFNARHSKIRLPECTHGGDTCANCYRYAVHWRQRVLDILTPPEEATVSTATATMTTEAVATAPPGATIECPQDGCGRPAKVTRSGRLWAHKTPAGTRCPMAGEVAPADARIVRPPAPATSAAELQLADELADLFADADFDFPPAMPDTIPLADAQWGMYGQVKGYGPTGERMTEVGYITKPPRVTTRGFSTISGRNRRRAGEQLLDFDLTRPGPAGTHGCVIFGMYAEMDAQFHLMETPADRPLTLEKMLSRRLPVADLRAGDVFHIWDEPGLDWNRDTQTNVDTRPRYHLQADPMLVSEGVYELDLLVDGHQPLTRELPGDLYTDIDDPQEVTFQKASDIEITTVRKAAARIPADAVDTTGALPTVLARWVALGTYVTATGFDEHGDPITATGYIVEASGARDGYGGRLRGAINLLYLSDEPDNERFYLRGATGRRQMVQIPEHGRVQVATPPAGAHPGTAYPWLRMPVEHQILSARHTLGLEVEIRPGPANELWRVQGCSEQLSTTVAEWMFAGKYTVWAQRSHPRFSPTLLAEAIHAGRYRRPRQTVWAPSTLVQREVIPAGVSQAEGERIYEQLLAAGKLIDGAGRPLRAVDCERCLVTRPHKITSGITCPYEVFCPTCQAKRGAPCTRPSGHVLSEKFGGQHATRAELARKVDDERALIGDLSVPAPWPTKPDAGDQDVAEQVDAAELAAGEETEQVNTGPVLDALLAEVDKPGQRHNAREAARRYAAGMPLVCKARELKRGWRFVCPVPSCLELYDGHDTVRQAREHWFAHAAAHEGFTPSWPDDLLPVEVDEQEAAAAKRPTAKSGRRRTGPLPAELHIVEPVGNADWDHSALGWEAAGLLSREVARTTDGGVVSYVTLRMELGFAKAVGFKDLLVTVWEIDKDSIVVRAIAHDPEPEQQPLFDLDDLLATLGSEE